MNIRGIITNKKILLLAGVLIISLVAYNRMSSRGTASVQYQTAQVERGTMIVAISSSGQISNANSGSISTQASGVVTKIYTSNGQEIKQGDPIAEIELDQAAKQNYAQALSSYQSAKYSLETAQQNYYTLRADLFSKNKIFKDLASNSFYTNGDSSPNTTNRQLAEFIVAENNWLASEAKYKSQQNAVAQAQTAYNASWLSLQESSPTIYAPISGTVTGLSLQIGTVLTSQTSSTGTITSQKVASIKTKAPPTVTINLSEIDVPKVTIGNKATITLDAFPEKSYTGQVVSIDTVGAVNSGVTTYATTVQFDTEVPEILSNMSAEANIITNSKTNVLLVPVSAVQTQNTESFVRVMRNGQPEEVPVEIGLSSDTQTEIVSGLTEGDTIVTSVVQTGMPQQSTQSSPFSAFGGRGFGGGGAVRVVR